jgi:single-stranded-DNA-specific exonuclease
MKIDPKIIELLRKRGIDTDEKLEEFLSDKPKETYDPFLLPDMEEGVDLILSACDNGEKICIYGDYDADGVTSVGILMEFLGYLTKNIEYYIPLRIEEGYGLNKDAVRTIHENGAKLLVTVDCGSVSYEEVELAKELGMRVLVTDHHSITDVQADCLMINPKRKDCIYPYKNLAGCGVAFKLAQAIQK